MYVLLSTESTEGVSTAGGVSTIFITLNLLDVD